MKVSTLSGTTAASIYPLNNQYNNGAGDQSTYNMPLGVAVNSQGVVYAIDGFVPVVRKIMPDGTTSKFVGDANFVMSTNYGSWEIGYVDGVSPKFSNLTAIAVDGQDNVYVMDYNRLRKITPDGVVSSITTDQTLFKSAAGIVVDANGNVFVANTGGKNIKKVTPQGEVTVLATGFTQPKGIALDSQGNLIVADSSVVKKVTQAGVVTNFLTGFNQANGVGIDAVGNIYVADSFNNVIRKYNSVGNLTATIGSGSPGYRDSSTIFFWRLPSFYNPLGVCVDKTGVVYVADEYTQRIRKITA